MNETREKRQYHATVLGAIVSTIFAFLSLWLGYKVSKSDTKIEKMDSVLALLTTQTIKQQSTISRLASLQSESQNQTEGIRSEIINQETQIGKQDKELGHLIDITGKLGTQINIGNKQFKSLETQLFFNEDLEKIKREGDLTSLRSTLVQMQQLQQNMFGRIGARRVDNVAKIPTSEKLAFLKGMYSLASFESKNSYIQLHDTIRTFWTEVPKRLMKLVVFFGDDYPQTGDFQNNLFLDFIFNDLNNLTWYTSSQINKEILLKPIIDIDKVKMY